MHIYRRCIYLHMRAVYFLCLILFPLSHAFMETCTCSESCTQREDLGRGTWFLLHSMAKHIDPTERNQMLFDTFLDILTELYPCSVCREHLRDNLRSVRPQLNTRSMCHFHNRINAQLGKIEYDCVHVE